MIRYIVILISILSFSSIAQDREITQRGLSDSDDTKPHLLDSGETIRVPADAEVIPGLPVIVTQKQLDSYENARKNLEQRGYVDAPDHSPSPTADVIIREGRQQANEKHTSEAVFKRIGDDARLSMIGLGKVKPEFLSSKTEGYMFSGQGNTMRAYSDTIFGNIFIYEMENARMGVLGNSGAEPNYSVAGAEGFKSKIQYQDGQRVSFYLLKSDDRVIALEISSDLDDVDEQIRFQEFIESLIHEREE